MKLKWFGIVAVIFIGASLVALKLRADAPGATNSEAGPTQVLIVADLGEAGTNDGCGKLIDAVRAARARGVRTVELSPESSSPLLTQYRVVLSPTVLSSPPTAGSAPDTKGSRVKSSPRSSIVLRRSRLHNDLGSRSRCCAHDGKRCRPATRFSRGPSRRPESMLFGALSGRRWSLLFLCSEQ